jgi:hypothetical protein
VLRRVFGSKRDEVKCGLREWLNVKNTLRRILSGGLIKANDVCRACRRHVEIKLIPSRQPNRAEKFLIN